MKNQTAIKKYWKRPELRASFKHARLLTEHHSKSFYISALLLPAQKRWATFALYGFCRYADNLIDNPRERSREDLLSETESLIQEISRAYKSGESEHPILQPFIYVAMEHNIPIEYPLDLLEGVKMDIIRKRYETFADLYTFCYRVAGVVGLMMTHVLGYESDAAFYYAEKLGIAMQLSNILRDIRDDKNMGRIYLPADELKAFNVREEDIFSEMMNANMRRLMRFQVERAIRYYNQANKGICLLKKETRFAINTSSRIYAALLKKIELREYNPFLGRVYISLSNKMTILIREIIRSKTERIISKMKGQNFGFDIFNNKIKKGATHAIRD